MVQNRFYCTIVFYFYEWLSHDNKCASISKEALFCICNHCYLLCILRVSQLKSALTMITHISLFSLISLSIFEVTYSNACTLLFHLIDWVHSTKTFSFFNSLHLLKVTNCSKLFISLSILNYWHMILILLLCQCLGSSYENIIISVWYLIEVVSALLIDLNRRHSAEEAWFE